MSKKQILMDNKRNVYLMLLSALGYDVDSTGYIIDQDTFGQVRYKNKILKFNPNGDYIPLHNRDLLFDPIEERGMAEKLFTTLMERESEDGELYMRIYYTVPDGPGLCHLEAILEDANSGQPIVLKTIPYHLVSCCYVDAILRYANTYSGYEECLKLIEGMLVE